MANAEFDITKNAIKAESRYKQFQYLLAIVVAAIFIAGFLSLREQINRKIDTLTADADTLVIQAVEQGKIRDREVTRYITCLFVIPPEERTEEVQLKCFREADLPGGLSENDFSPYVNSSAAVDAVPKVGALSTPGVIDSSSSSSPNGSPNNNNSQPDNSQPEPQSPQPEPSLLETLTQPVNDLVDGVQDVLGGILR